MELVIGAQQGISYMTDSAVQVPFLNIFCVQIIFYFFSAHPYGRLQSHPEPADGGGGGRGQGGPGHQGHVAVEGGGERRVVDHHLPQPHPGREHGGPGGRILQAHQQLQHLHMEQKR